MSKAVIRTFSHDFTGPRERVWEAMADTSRYNAAAGLPQHVIEHVATEGGGTSFLASAKMGWVSLQWRDHPCNWVKERWFEHNREFSQGPLKRLDVRFELHERTPSGCHGLYTMSVVPRGAIGVAVTHGGLMRGGGKAFKELAREADGFARGERTHPFEQRPAKLTDEQRERLARLVRELAETPYAHGLAQNLADFVAGALDPEVERIRPRALARRWQRPEREVIELCLQATRSGLLELRWDLLCPRCRAAKLQSTGLDALPTGTHCDTCNIDYGRDFSRNVELSFKPSRLIRPSAEGEFCVLGPMSTPHIWAHVTVGAGAARDIELALPAGMWRVRTLEPGPELDVEHAGGAFGHYRLSRDGVERSQARAGDPIALANDTAYTRTFVIEDRRWLEDALRGDEITSLQAFRDLFSEEILRPGDEVGIERMAILFTDLRGSTALYESIGDAAAYSLVREHFAFLMAIVREHDGALVKTLGDAVMAAFHDPAQAMRAALAMQARVAGFNHGRDQPIVLKLGLHTGPCIGVTLNGRLDYFGRTANVAARLQGQSRGDDVVVSATTATLPEIATLLDGYDTARESAELRGVPEPVRFLRIQSGSPTAQRSHEGVDAAVG